MFIEGFEKSAAFAAGITAAESLGKKAPMFAKKLVTHEAEKGTAPLYKAMQKAPVVTESRGAAEHTYQPGAERLQRRYDKAKVRASAAPAKASAPAAKAAPEAAKEAPAASAPPATKDKNWSVGRAGAWMRKNPIKSGLGLAGAGYLAGKNSSDQS